MIPNLTVGIPIEHPPPYEIVQYSVPVALPIHNSVPSNEEESMFSKYLRDSSENAILTERSEYQVR